jgi:threonine synthase
MAINKMTTNYNLLDGSPIKKFELNKESYKLSEMVKDPSLSLIDRLECYEDIIHVEVGDTALHRAKNLERSLEIRQIFLKYEGGNPTGTQKDRIAFAQCHDAIRRGFEIITVATCGNYGAAVALAANLAGLKCIIYIPSNYHTNRIKEMERLGAEIIRKGDTYEESVTYSSQQAEKNEWYDANPGGANTVLQINAYAAIAHEIYDQLRDAPLIVAVPVSNGTLLAGIYRGFVALYKRGKTSRIPKMIAGSSSFKNPIVNSFKKNYPSCIDLNPDKIMETSINEPLINWHSFDGEEALYAIYESKGHAYDVSDKKMLKFAKTLEDKEGLKALPASTAGIIGLTEYLQTNEITNDRFVAIITAKD